jgi:DeoR family ulaG and ulaABCDEF operon transcriptional repressor
MTTRARHSKLVEFVQENTFATVAQLVDLLETSPATVRRDITELDKQGLIKKIRNGAEKILSPRQDESSGLGQLYPNISDFSNYTESDRIAKTAVELCQDKDNVFIGEGQTTFLMGKYLTNKNIHVYTNYLPLITYLISEDFPHLVVLGGQYIKNQNLLVSAEKHISYQGRYLFVSGDGLTDGGLTKSALLAFMEEKKMLEYADKVIALVDSDKIGVFGGMALFGLDELDMVITGRDADPAILELLKKNNVAVVRV